LRGRCSERYHKANIVGVTVGERLPHPTISKKVTAMNKIVCKIAGELDEIKPVEAKFSLLETANGGVSLECNGYAVLDFNSNGTVERLSGNYYQPFPTDNYGKIIIE